MGDFVDILFLFIICVFVYMLMKSFVEYVKEPEPEYILKEKKKGKRSKNVEKLHEVQNLLMNHAITKISQKSVKNSVKNRKSKTKKDKLSSSPEEDLLKLLKKMVEFENKLEKEIENKFERECSKINNASFNKIRDKDASLKRDNSLQIDALATTGLMHTNYGPPTYPCQYPMSVLHALKMLPDRRLGNQCLLEDITTLDIHVVTSKPVFDEHWPVLLHLLPKLRQLNLTFVMQGTPFMQPLSLSTIAKLGILKKYEYQLTRDDQVMAYFIKQMHYHMYFSSLEYDEPDVVVVFNNSYEMMESKEEDIHSDISYSNMTHSSETVLVLMDATQELLKKGVDIVDAARPVDEIVTPQINPQRGFSTLDMAESETYYFTCLKRQ